MKFLKNRKMALMIGAIGASFFAQNALADTTTNATTENTDALIKNITVQTQQLEKQVSTLKKEVRQLKAEQKQRLKQQENSSPVHIIAQPNLSLPQGTMAYNKKPPVTYVSGTPVVIAPYVGEHTSFGPSDLVVYYSSYNEDLTLLQLRRDIFSQYQSAGQPLPQGPMVMLSGKVETQANYLEPYAGSHQSKVDLSGAELDIVPIINQWASGLITFVYDNSVLPGQPRTSNSRIHVDRGFLTIGNLNQLPFYTTIGQMYVPFGHYTSSMISNTIPQDIFQTRARAVELGYQKSDNNGLYSQVYAFNGDAQTSTNSNVNDLGANLGFKFTNQAVSIDLGGAVIADVADSLGMQQNGNSTGFTGFSATSNVLHRQVPGASVTLTSSINQGSNAITFLAEYITAMSPFATQDMTFDTHGAKPQAFNTELGYSFKVLSKPSSVAIGYGNSRDALALNVPESRYIAAFNTSVWKDTVESIELRHDINYAVTDTAGGAGTAFAPSGLGETSNSVLAQIGIYF